MFETYLKYDEFSHSAQNNTWWWLTSPRRKAQDSDRKRLIRPFSQAFHLSAMQRNVTYDVAYPMHVWRLFVNLKMHAHWSRRTLCFSRSHRISAHATWIRERRKKKNERRHRSLRNRRCRNVDEHAVEWIKTIVMRLRGWSSSYRSGRWVELIILSFSVITV